MYSCCQLFTSGECECAMKHCPDDDPIVTGARTNGCETVGVSDPLCDRVFLMHMWGFFELCEALELVFAARRSHRETDESSYLTG